MQGSEAQKDQRDNQRRGAQDSGRVGRTGNLVSGREAFLGVGLAQKQIMAVSCEWWCSAALSWAAFWLSTSSATPCPHYTTLQRTAAFLRYSHVSLFYLFSSRIHVSHSLSRRVLLFLSADQVDWLPYDLDAVSINCFGCACQLVPSWVDCAALV
jgi:hypothetical protein